MRREVSLDVELYKAVTMLPSAEGATTRRTSHASMIPMTQVSAMRDEVDRLSAHDVVSRPDFPSRDI